VNIQQLPTHLHALQAINANAGTNTCTNGFLAQSNNLYHSPTALTSLNPASVSSIGGSQAHNNMMPYLVLNFIIALQGIFPSQN